MRELLTYYDIIKEREQLKEKLKALKLELIKNEKILNN